MLEKLEESDCKAKCIALFWKAADISITIEMSEDECKAQYMRALEVLKELSILLRQIKSKIIFTEALADILYLYCHTYTYFTPTEAYTRFEGEEV